MEPLSTSTIAFLVSWAATANPNWNAEKKTKNEGVATSISQMYLGVAANEPTIAKPLTPIGDTIQVENTTGDVFAQLDSYSKLEPGWDGPGSAKPSFINIELAIDFIGSIPAIFPLPKAMLSRDGELGLYWDDSVVYVDIQFESDHTLSVFSRDRSSGKEKFVDSVDVTAINPNWYFDTLDALLISTRYAVAAA